MMKRNKYLKVIYWVFACAFILAGCADDHGAKEKISVENGKEERAEEKTEEAESGSGRDFMEEDTADSTESIVMEAEIVDAWFTGFAEGTEGKIYFCVHLGRTDGMNVSSSGAKEIAIQIVSDFTKNCFPEVETNL
jgi:hypothetical protein